MTRRVRFVGGAADGIELDVQEIGDTWPPYSLQHMAGEPYQRVARPITDEAGNEIWEFYREGVNAKDQRQG